MSLPGATNSGAPKSTAAIPTPTGPLPGGRAVGEDGDGELAGIDAREAAAADVEGDEGVAVAGEGSPGGRCRMRGRCRPCRRRSADASGAWLGDIERVAEDGEADRAIEVGDERALGAVGAANLGHLARAVLGDEDLGVPGAHEDGDRAVEAAGDGLEFAVLRIADRDGRARRSDRPGRRQGRW